MQTTLYDDPTLDAAVSMEVEDKQCAVCTRRRVLSEGGATCGVGHVYPFCKRSRDGFELDAGGF